MTKKKRRRINKLLKQQRHDMSLIDLSETLNINYNVLYKQRYMMKYLEARAKEISYLVDKDSE